jgi:serine/threonine protein kinase
MAQVGEQSNPLAPTLPDAEIVAGQLLSARYRPDELLLTHNGISIWRGWDEVLDRMILLYIIPPNHPSTDAMLGAARNASATSDARFLRVLDALEYGPGEITSFIVTECVPGYHLHELIAQTPLSNLSAAWLVDELARGLAPLHAQGLAHGRLNPGSVIITATGNVKIAGFLIDAAMYPRPGDDYLTWADQSAQDVRALGKILYASLTGAWPLFDDEPLQSTYGLPMASKSGPKLLSPAAANPGVSSRLDLVCMSILQPEPGTPPLTTMAQIATTLQGILGSADAADDLAFRVQWLSEAEAVARTGAIPAGESAPVPMASFVDPERTTGLVTPPLPSLSEPQPVPEDVQDIEPGPSQVMTELGRGEVADSEDYQPVANSNEPRLRPGWFRWAVLVGIVAVLVAILLIIKAVVTPDNPDPEQPPNAPETSQTVPAEPVTADLPIAAAGVFDPVADGGDATEDNASVGLAIDGDAASAWTTEPYAADYLGVKKPGVGLLLDLGAAKQTTGMQLSVTQVPDAVRILVPAENPESDTAPMTSVNEWRNLTTAELTQATTPLTWDNTTTRWIVIYFTAIPQQPTGVFQTGITNVTVQGVA